MMTIAPATSPRSPRPYARGRASVRHSRVPKPRASIATARRVARRIDAMSSPSARVGKAPRRWGMPRSASIPRARRASPSAAHSRANNRKRREAPKRPPTETRRGGPGRPPPAAERHRAIRETGDEVAVVAREEHAAARRAVAREHGDELAVGAPILPERRLVEDEQRWCSGERGRDGEAPLLATGERERVRRGGVREGEGPEQLP